MKPKNNPIHGLKKRGWLEKKWMVEAVGSGPPIIAAAVGGLKLISEESTPPWLLIATAGTIVWLTGAAILKVLNAREQDRKGEEARSHDGLVASLHVLHATVASAGKLQDGDKDSCLRATFHRVVPPLDAADKIEQIVPYVGGNRDGAGRTFEIRSGITGCAIREKAILIMDRKSDSYEDYKSELIKEWHYTEHDVKNITSDRYSAIAVPVASRNGQDVLGVIYLDSSKRDFFSSDVVKEAVVAASAGVTRYTGERYV